MLIGHYITRLTEKGRTALPAKYREELGNDAILAKWYEGCLVIVNKDSWHKVIDGLTGRVEIITKPVRDTERFILGSAFEITLDKQGRFVIPKLLRDYANLTNEIVFVGLGSRVEIWNTKGWYEKQQSVQETAAELVEKLAENKTRTTEEKVH